MAYQKYNDPAKLLLDICQPNWGDMSPEEIDDLLADMSQLGLDMGHDKIFKREYTIATKELYLSYVSQQKKGNYVPPLFRDLDKEIRLRIAENHQLQSQTEVLIPEYNVYASENMSHAHSVKAKVAMLRANLMQKSLPDNIVPNQRK